MSRRPNYNWIMQNWQLVAMKLCEEVTSHDMLDMFISHVESSCVELDRAGISSKRRRKALEKLNEAKSLLNPEIG